ncbi:MAG: peptide-methionine (S)-S-oxide reductase MsrA [Flavobacteriales bacterium]|jgi:peptide-methionine (S)-S-oxide reductase|nr:peptide-methionine (S)-S-oxide reductase MsrA [Flavobacteriales bacterium]
MKFQPFNQLHFRLRDILVALGSAFILFYFSSSSYAQTQESMNTETTQFETITLGAGCFWCIEAVFESIPGVQQAVSGYSGGHIKNPAYREVCSGRTGHAEVIQVTFDPKALRLELLLEVFFGTHDPTTLNRQGADVGTQYRSAIYYHTPQQKEVALAAVVRAQKDWSSPIVTEVTEFETFYEAENVHQAYYEMNKEAPYCRAVITPKMQKFKKDFGTKFE